MAQASPSEHSVEQNGTHNARRRIICLSQERSDASTLCRGTHGAQRFPVSLKMARYSAKEPILDHGSIILGCRSSDHGISFLP